jgi:IS605 OrfB family transposase
MSGEEINFFCEFPYGQELIETALNLEKGERQAVCWSIEDWGNSFLVKCMINLKSERKNFCYTSGVIGIDVNADNISVAETDKSGNLLSHEVIDFNILNKSSEQIEQILSLSLERVYKIAEDRRKPVVMEKLEDIKQEYLYQGKRLNETLSMFAYSKITELALSKSNKYNIDIKQVNPAFTSQMGKIKYLKKHGLSVHEAAAYVIARRGQGFAERLPKNLLEQIPETKINKHHWSHWSHLHKKFKKINWKECYN